MWNAGNCAFSWFDSSNSSPTSRINDIMLIYSMNTHHFLQSQALRRPIGTRCITRNLLAAMTEGHEKNQKFTRAAEGRTKSIDKPAPKSSVSQGHFSHFISSCNLPFLPFRRLVHFVGSGINSHVNIYMYTHVL